MRRWLSLGCAVVLAAFAWMANAAAGEPTVERQRALIHLLKHDCGSCHGLTLKGGLGPPLVPAALTGKPASWLTEIILNGVPGTPMPPWATLLSARDAAWLATRLKDGL